VAAAFVETWIGVEVVGVTVGVVVKKEDTVVWVVKEEVKTTVPPGLVAVLSDGTVMTSVTGTEVSSVMGTCRARLALQSRKIIKELE